jgi:hypothetical protein
MINRSTPPPAALLMPMAASKNRLSVDLEACFLFGLISPFLVPALQEGFAPRPAASVKAAPCVETGRFFACEKYWTPLLPKGRCCGAELGRVGRCCRPLPFPQFEFQKMVGCGCRWVCGRSRAFPRFPIWEAGEAQAFGQSPIVHISTGTSSWPLCVMAVIAPCR